MDKIKKESAPQSAAQRKAAQRARNKAAGLVMVKFPELWVSPEVAEKIQSECAVIIANAKSNVYSNSD